MDLDKAVNRGMRMLDRRRPGWDDEIDEGGLHVGCGSRCIVGQLCGSFTNANANRIIGFWRCLLCWAMFRSPAEHYGFTTDIWYGTLTKTWKQAIKARRDKRGHRRPKQVLANAV